MDELDVFSSVVEEQGLNAAAKWLDSAPVAVIRRIKTLEQRRPGGSVTNEIQTIRFVTDPFSN